MATSLRKRTRMSDRDLLGQPDLLEQPIAARCILGLGILLALGSIWLCRNYYVDDALITLRYAQNFLSGHGLSFNPGEIVEGFTNLGHLVLVIGLGSLGLDLVTASRLVGLLGALAAVVWGPAAMLPLRREHAIERAIARLFLMANFFFVYLAVTGMETGLYVGLICATAYFFKQAEDRASILVGLLAGSLFVVRPDGVLYGGAIMFFALIRHGPRAFLSMPGPWVWVSVIAAVEVWRFQYFGYWVPNTALIKGAGSVGFVGASTPWYALVGDDAMELLSQSGGLITVFFALVAMIRYPHQDRIQLAVGMIVLAFAFDIYADGDWMLGYRFLMPLLPFYLSMVAIGIMEAVRALKAAPVQGRSSLAWLNAGLAVALVVFAVGSWGVGLEFRFHSDKYPRTHMTSEYMIPAAKWIGDHYPSDYQVVAGAIGSLAYYGQLVVIDMVGLTNRSIALASGRKALKDEYVASRNPELVLVNASLNPPDERELFGRAYQMRRYFNRGIERPWVLYERADLPEAAAPRDSGAQSDTSLRLHQAERVPMAGSETAPGTDP